jgi:precorrin-2 dehydrogenase / sirohydrochlorin ferrochelatase
VFYPVFLDLSGRRVLVVGGGTVAERKVASLLEAGAAVTLVAPVVNSALAELARSSTIELRQRKFLGGDLEGVVLVISATDDATAQQQVAAAARARAVPINTVDQPQLCDFIVPAIVRKGDVIVAISTSGRSPALAAALRAKVETVITDEAARAAQVLGEIRGEVHARFPDADRRKQVFETIVASGIVDWIRECDDATALQRVRGMIEKLV